MFFNIFGHFKTSKAKPENKAPSFLISVRFMLAILAFFAYAVQYTQKTDISVAIVCMINNTAINGPTSPVSYNITSYSNRSDGTTSSQEPQCKLESNSTDGPLAWSKDTQGLVLSAYFWGYMITEIPGGFLSIRFGSVIVLGLSILIGSIVTIILPVLARASYIGMLVGRLVVGCAHGVIWPALSGFWASWAPPHERSRLIGTANAGSQIGNVIAMSLGGYLCENGFDGGWGSIFYIFGIFGIVWTAAWFLLASDTPEKHRFISDKEKEYVLEETKETRASHADGEQGAPWNLILQSRACAAIFIGHTCSNWGTYLFLTQLPTYLKEILKFDIHSNGLLSSVPYLAFWLSIMISDFIGDQMLERCKLQKTVVRKIFNALALFLPMFAVIGLMFVDCSSHYVGVALLTIGLAFTGCGYGAGFLVNYNDVAGHYSAIVFGIGNTLATMPGIIAPYLVGVLTKNKEQSEWRNVFIITAVVYFIGGAVLVIFTSGELEVWAQRHPIELRKKSMMPRASIVPYEAPPDNAKVIEPDSVSVNVRTSHL